MTYRSNEVADIIRDAITTHKLLPGAKLIEREIVEALGVSRVVARQALIKLSDEGLVQWQANKGASVARPELDDILALFDALVVIEQAVIGRAPDLVGSDDWKNLSRHSRQEASQEYDAPESAADFHVALVALSKNKYLIDFYQKLHRQAFLLQAIYGHQPRARPLMHDHDTIISLAEAGKIDEAKAMVRKHQDDILRTYSLKDTTRKSLPLKEALRGLNDDGKHRPPEGSRC